MIANHDGLLHMSTVTIPFLFYMMQALLKYKVDRSSGLVASRAVNIRLNRYNDTFPCSYTTIFGWLFIPFELQLQNYNSSHLSSIFPIR